MTTRARSKLVSVTTASAVFNVRTELGGNNTGRLLLTNLGADYVSVDERGGTATAAGDDFIRIPAGKSRVIGWSDSIAMIANAGTIPVEVCAASRGDIIFS